MQYNDPYQYLKFSCGRSVGNFKKDAKKFARINKINHAKALDSLSIDYSEKQYSSWPEAKRGLIRTRCEEIISEQSKPTTITDIVKFGHKHPTLTCYGIDCIRGDDFEIDPTKPKDEYGFPNYLIDPEKIDKGELHPYVEKPFDVSLKMEHELLFNVTNANYFKGALNFLRLVKPSEEINENHGRDSYGLKHLVEWYYRCLNKPIYIPHGVFIAAALYRGYLIKRYGRSAFFNIEEKSLLAIEAECKRLNSIPNST